MGEIYIFIGLESKDLMLYLFLHYFFINRMFDIGDIFNIYFRNLVELGLILISLD